MFQDEWGEGEGVGGVGGLNEPEGYRLVLQNSWQLAKHVKLVSLTRKPKMCTFDSSGFSAAEEALTSVLFSALRCYARSSEKDDNGCWHLLK